MDERIVVAITFLEKAVVANGMAARGVFLGVDEKEARGRSFFPLGPVPVLPSPVTFVFASFPLNLFYRHLKKAKNRVLAWSVSMSVAPEFWKNVQELDVDLRVLLGDPDGKMKVCHPKPSEHKERVDNLLAEVVKFSVTKPGTAGKFRLIDFPLYSTGFIVDSVLFLINHEFMKRSSETECHMRQLTEKDPMEQQFQSMWNQGKTWAYTPERLKLVVRPAPKLARDFPDLDEL